MLDPTLPETFPVMSDSNALRYRFVPATQNEAASSGSPVVAALPRNITPQRANEELDSVTDTTLNSDSIELAQANDNDSRVISVPGLAEQLQQAQETDPGTGTPAVEEDISASQQNTESPGTQIAASPMLAKALTLWQDFLQKIGSLNTTGWLMLAAVLSIPILLVALFSVIRKRKRNAYQTVPRSPISDRIEPELRSQQQRQEQEAAELFGNEKHYGQSLESPSDSNAETRLAEAHQNEHGSANDTLDTLELTDPEENKVENDVFSRADLTQDPFDFETEDNEKATELPSNFQVWLYQKPKDTQMRFCIDFLVYWMAYGDERYDPSLKKRIFEAKKLADNDLIKRWVLQNDIHAFAEAVAWMRKNATQAQLEETVSLLMALLITENNVTPVQNTLLRFLADAFNMGEDGIQNLFEAAFGHELPPMPRPDRAPWWDKQEESDIARWDSRKMAELPEQEKLLIRLGLTEEHNESDIIQAFRRAAKRCHPDRFPNLSERERAMAEHRFAKFEEARDKLLGVSV